MNELQKYPALFHKYLLNIADKDKPIKYEIIINSIKSMKENICHLHIFDITSFEYFFGNMIQQLDKYFTIIVTYCNGTLINNYIPFETWLNNRNIQLVCLKIDNRGYDIGGKICMLDYINNLKIDYKNILFLHSKTNKMKRIKYFSGIMSKLDEIMEIVKLDNVLGIFPNTIWYNHNGMKNYRSYDVYQNNEVYLNDLFNYIGCKNKIKIFSEGNCMILNRKVIDYIFTNNILIFYNILNYNNSFDYNWFITYYKYKLNTNIINHINQMYLEYSSKSLYGNNNQLKKSASSHPDGMIEHVFERLWINVILELGGECYIADINNLVHLNKYFNL